MTSDDTERGLPVQYDLKITEARNFCCYIGTTQLRSEILIAPCKTFQKNVERARLLASVPQMVTEAVTKQILMLCESTFKVLQKPVMDDNEVKTHKQEIKDAYALVAYAHDRSDGFFSDKREMLQLFVNDALHYHKYESIASPLRWNGYYALLASQVITAWTAIETLIEDAWVAVVNAHPDLAVNFFHEKNFKISELKHNDFNWQGRVGYLLKDRMDFGHLERERETYERTFPNQKQLHARLASNKLETVHCIRNVLVHNAGFASKGYDQRRKGSTDKKIKKKPFRRPWCGVGEGELLPLDGKNVAKLTSTIVVTGNHLLLALDKYLQKRAAPDSKSPDQAP